MLVVLTIFLSVALLSAFSLSIIGMNEDENRQLQVSNHVLYADLSNEQIENLCIDERIKETLFVKQGSSTETGNYLIVPVYIEQKDGTIETEKIVEGHYPQAIDEIAVDKAYMNKIGKELLLGNRITITFFDGTIETFTVTGFTDISSTESAYSLYLSRDYAENGSQLKDATSMVAAQINNTNSMTEHTFLNEVRKIGSDYGISPKNIDPNDAFAKSLSVDSEEVLIILLASMIILLVSFLVIYSIFYIYVKNQIREFGQLRTLGATSKQIKRMLKVEGRILCIIGTVAGLPIGCIVAYLFKPNGWNWENTLIVGALVFVFSYITVLLSLSKPAKVASIVSPIDASKASGSTDIKTSVSKQTHRKITPFALAKMGADRNRKKSTMTIISLSIAGIMFMSGTTLIASLDMEKFARHGMMAYGEFIISLSKNAEKTNDHSYTGLQKNNPIDDKLTDEITAIDGVKEVYPLKNLVVSYEYGGDDQDRNSLSPFRSDQVELLEQFIENGKIDYGSMVQNKEILIMRNSNSEFVHGWKFKVGDTVKLRWFDGSEYQSVEYTIAGEISDDIFENYDGGREFGIAGYFIAPEELVRQMMLPDFNLNKTVVVSISDFDKEPEIRAQIEKIVNENPLLTLDTLNDYMEESLMRYQHTCNVIWGISAFIMLFAFINLINTLATNTLSRKKEFAILRSIGMSNRQLMKTIQYEGLILAFLNVLITGTVGSACGYAIIKYLNSVGDTSWNWNFPLIFFLGYIAIAIILPIIISAVVINILKEKSLVERLRETE